MTIQDFIRACKSPDAVTAAVIVVVGFGSFGLGRLSVISAQKTPITITERFVSSIGSAVLPIEEQLGKEFVGQSNEPISETISSGSVVGSKNGSKYHFPWCAGAQRISEGNKVWFASIEAARTAGYSPASNCKGLK